MNYARIFSFNRLMDCDVTRTSNDVGYVADICAGAVHNRVLTNACCIGQRAVVYNISVIYGDNRALLLQVITD